MQGKLPNTYFKMINYMETINETNISGPYVVSVR